VIIKNFEIKKVDLNKNPFVLLYGKNEELKNQIKIELLKNKSITSNYEEREILDNADQFIETLVTKSLFESEKLIIINRASDKLLKILSEIVEKKIQDLIIIVDADNLEKKSKIRSFFEKGKNCICIPFYPDTDQILFKIASEYLRKKNISISSSDLNFVVNKCKGDRKFLFTELEKIELFTKNGKKITKENLGRLINLIENHSINELVDSFLSKNKRRTIKILGENNFNRDDCILITRIFLNKLKKILKLSIEYENNKNLDLTISSAKPQIFWKEKEMTKQQILNWDSKNIKKLLYKINNLELLIKKNYDNSINLIIDFMLDQNSTSTNN
tara:strand:- start:117 stop:1109 length:993 start_codon:yes stop_codon:yes gene_type:complete